MSIAKIYNDDGTVLGVYSLNPCPVCSNDMFFDDDLSISCTKCPLEFRHGLTTAIQPKDFTDFVFIWNSWK